MSEGEKACVELKEYVERLLAEQEKQFTIRLEGQIDAVRMARSDMERRLDELNRLRAEVTQDRGQFVPKIAYDLWHDVVESRMTRIETRATTRGEVWGLVLATAVAVAGLVLGAVKLFK